MLETAAVRGYPAANGPATIGRHVLKRPGQPVTNADRAAARRKVAAARTLLANTSVDVDAPTLWRRHRAQSCRHALKHHVKEAGDSAYAERENNGLQRSRTVPLRQIRREAQVMW